MARKSTSIPEQAILYYVKSIYSDAINRHKITGGNGKKYEADVFIPSIKVAIEYNGEHWHSSRESRDIEKNQAFSRLGIYSIVILEGALKEIKIENGIIIRHSANSSHGLHMNEVIENTLHLLAIHTANSTQKILATNFSLSYERYCKDYPDIVKSIFTTYCEDNVTKYCTFCFWDAYKNRDINPEFIPANTTARFWYRCPSGISFRIAPREYRHRIDECNKKCSKCAYHLCPFLSACPVYTKWVDGHLPLPLGICQYIQNHIWDYVLGDGNWPKLYSNQLALLVSYSPDGMDLELLRKYNDLETTAEEKERILNVFGAYHDSSKSYRAPDGRAFQTEGLVLKIPNACTIDDLMLCRRIIEKLDWLVIIRFSNFQDSLEKEKAACEFFDWTVNRWQQNDYQINRYLQFVRLPFCSGDLNENFEKKLSAVLKKHNIKCSLPIFCNALANK